MNDNIDISKTTFLYYIEKNNAMAQYLKRLTFARRLIVIGTEELLYFKVQNELTKEYLSSVVNELVIEGKIRNEHHIFHILRQLSKLDVLNFKENFIIEEFEIKPEFNPLSVKELII